MSTGGAGRTDGDRVGVWYRLRMPFVLVRSASARYVTLLLKGAR